jgi:hypothetical protein
MDVTSGIPVRLMRFGPRDGIDLKGSKEPVTVSPRWSVSARDQAMIWLGTAPGELSHVNRRHVRVRVEAGLDAEMTSA